MRDLVVTLIVLWSLPRIFKQPFMGVLMWIWISIMNPHRLSWGFATNFPFAFIIAIVTFLSFLFSREPKKIPMVPATVTMLLFILWMNVSSVFAIHFDQLYFHWSTIMKVLAMTLVCLALTRTQQQIRLVVWALVISIGFYGVKGGIFTVLSGGSFLVWGPSGTFIEDNNALALSLIMTIPLMRFLQLEEPKKWVRRGLTVAMALSAFSAVGSYSRGALLAILASAIFLWLKSPKKLPLAVALVLFLPLLFAFMPEKWVDRMHTIDNYQQDASAMGRINAWNMAWNLALDRPLVGGGFEIYDPEVFARYAPNPKNVHAAHSIYFQVLGEHGFVGLAFFLAMGFFTRRDGNAIIRLSLDRPELKWAGTLAKMLQVSQVAYATGGAFLSLAYFDLPYYVLVLMVVTRRLVEQETVGVTSLRREPLRRHPKRLAHTTLKEHP